MNLTNYHDLWKSRPGPWNFNQQMIHISRCANTQKIWLYIVFATCLGKIGQKPILDVSAPYRLNVIALNEEEHILF